MVVLQLLESDWKSQWIPRRVLRCSELFHGRMFTCVLELKLIVLDVLIWIHVCQRSQFALGQALVCLKFLVEFSHIGRIGRFHDDLDLDGSICLCAHAFIVMIYRMPSFLGLAGLLLFRLILVALVVGDALVNVLEEMLGKLQDLGFIVLGLPCRGSSS